MCFFILIINLTNFQIEGKGSPLILTTLQVSLSFSVHKCRQEKVRSLAGIV
ncbi:hypothetical protein B4144_1852 [Bacillus atrophaeus]|nr:hypothetical protein B4144_1852 [Bacillus atrophaeus]